MNPLRAAYAITTASRYALGVVAGCAAPLWCRWRGHGPWYPVTAGGGLAARQCVNCGVVRR